MRVFYLESSLGQGAIFLHVHQSSIELEFVVETVSVISEVESIFIVELIH